MADSADDIRVETIRSRVAWWRESFPASHPSWVDDLGFLLGVVDAMRSATKPPQPDAVRRDVPHKAATERALAALATMPRAELLATFVDAGIVDENGKLTEAYRPVEPDAGRKGER